MLSQIWQINANKLFILFFFSSGTKTMLSSILYQKLAPLGCRKSCGICGIMSLSTTLMLRPLLLLEAHFLSKRNDWNSLNITATDERFTHYEYLDSNVYEWCFKYCYFSNSGDFVSAHMDQPKSLINAIKTHFPDFDLSEGAFLKACEVAKRPRLVKFHLGLPLLNPKLLDVAKVGLIKVCF